MKKLLIIISLFAFQLNAAEQEPVMTFIEKARGLATTYGVKTIITGEGENERICTYIPNENGHPFAVLKEKSVAKQAFTAQYARKLHLDNVALSATVNDLIVKGKDQPFRGLVEEYISVRIGEASTLDQDLNNLIQKYIVHNSLSLYRFTFSRVADSRDKHQLLNHIDIDSVHKFFSYVILVNDHDAQSQNIHFQLNQQNKLEMKNFDTEYAFSEGIATCGLGDSPIYSGLAFMDIPISAKVKDIINSWTLEDIRSAEDEYKKCGDEIKGSWGEWFNNQKSRIEALQQHLKICPQTTPLDFLLFASLNISNELFINYCGEPLGKYLVSCINENGMRFWNPNYYSFGVFFEGGLTGYRNKDGVFENSTSYVGAIKDYNKTKEANQEEKTLHDFMKFIPHLKYFKQEKFEEFKIYVYKKFDFDITQQVK